MSQREFFIKEDYAGTAYQKALEMLSRDAIKPEQFADLYQEKMVQDDCALVDKMEKRFASENTENLHHLNRLATVFEALIHYHGEQSDWFGPFATTIKTSRFDDIVNGVDEIIEFTEPAKITSHLALAIDATFNTAEIEAKLIKIIKKIDSGEAIRVKYFQSSDNTYRGELNLVPSVIICADEQTIKELSRLWLDDPKKLAGHHIQLQILEEIKDQLDFFAAYAEQAGQIKIAERYRHALGIIEEVYKQKQLTTKDVEERDEAYAILLARLEIFRQKML